MLLNPADGNSHNLKGFKDGIVVYIGLTSRHGHQVFPGAEKKELTLDSRV